MSPICNTYNSYNGQSIAMASLTLMQRQIADFTFPRGPNLHKIKIYFGKWRQGVAGEAESFLWTACWRLWTCNNPRSLMLLYLIIYVGHTFPITATMNWWNETVSWPRGFGNWMTPWRSLAIKVWESMIFKRSPSKSSTLVRRPNFINWAL